MAARRAFLIDGTACCYRAFHAIRALNASDGRPTNAVYGVALMLRALRAKEHPDYLAVAFDVGKPTFRHRKFEAYKIQRKPMPDALIFQLPIVKRLLAAYRIPVFEQEGFEAEDVLATIAKRLAGPELAVYLVTGDKDALQLVNAHVKIYNPQKDGMVLDARAVEARYGVVPEQMVDLMALMGDEIDNIPGVPGIGEKTAARLLQQFGSLERLFERLEDVESPARRKALAAARAQVELSRELVQIDTNVPVTCSLDQLESQEPEWNVVRALCRELGFKTLLEAVEQEGPPPEVRALPVRWVTPARGLALTTRITAAKQAAVGCWPAQRDTEDGGLFGTPDAGVLLAMAAAPDEAAVIHLDRPALRTAPGQALAAWLNDRSKGKIAHDAKTVIGRLSLVGLSLQGVAGDTMVAAYLLNPTRTSQPLADALEEFLQERLPPPPAVDTVLQSGEGIEPFGQYVCAVLRLHQHLVPSLAACGLSQLYTDLELPLIDVLARMERDGMAIDVPYLKGLRATMGAQLAGITQEIYRLAGGEFNLNSPKQLAQVLFERLQLPVIKRTKTGPSTDSDVLRQLAARHPMVERLIAYRGLSKLVSTYVEALPKLADPATGRLHTSFNQAATATGRLSSSDPNLQNIPIKTELGRMIRKAFIPGLDGGVLLAADYSQIELRILAHVSGDERLMEAFLQDRDIHRFTASLIYGIPEGQVGREQRSAMKAVNFGILYGMSAHGLSRELGMSFEEAQGFIASYFERYPNVLQYMERQIAQATRDGFVQTLLGRRRYIPELSSPDAMTRQFGERVAVNAPVQGTAADLIKRAMIQIAAALDERQLQSRMILQVHDELVFECPRRELDTVGPIVRQIMEGALTLRVPLVVALKAGPNWLDLAPLT